MKVVALISGGKDSTFNMIHCVLQGHEIVAMANLHPPASNESDEMDSFMYQTVGYSALLHYSECMGGVPMYRREIAGKSAVTSLEYRPTDEKDETEDLYQLLKSIIQQHPEIDAVSVGAILSTYQRTRVENVCGRLGLTSLAYLWERSQEELLDEIVDSGVDARIIKTAAYGLGEKHLGKSLGQIRGELKKLNSMFGLHLCGEGGEYETLVVDSPLFVKRLIWKEEKIVGSSKDEVYHLTFGGFETVEKKGIFGVNNVESWRHQIRIPPLLQEDYKQVYMDLNSAKIPEVSLSSLNIENNQFPSFKVDPSTTSNSIVNITAPSSYKTKTIEEEATALFDVLKSLESTNGIESTSQYTSASLILSDMKDFQTVNQIYSAHFPHPLPPSRVCIESCTILNSMRLQLSLTFTPNSKKKGLHVQGRSYWAPANIGPYSQSTCSQGAAHFAGQIPLIPATMALVESEDISLQSVLSLQHLDRVRAAVPVRVEKFAVVLAVVDSDVAGEFARCTWSRTIDIVDDNQECAMFVIKTSALPRAAHVEWTAFGVDQTELDAFDIDDDEEYEKTLVFSWDNENGFSCKFGKQIYRVLTPACKFNGSKYMNDDDDENEVQNRNDDKYQLMHGTLYLTRKGVQEGLKCFELYSKKLEIIMVDSITDSKGVLLDFIVLSRHIRQ